MLKKEIQNHINKANKIKSDQDHLVCHPNYIYPFGVALSVIPKNCFLHPLVCQILGLHPHSKITSKIRLIFPIVYFFNTSLST